MTDAQYTDIKAQLDRIEAAITKSMGIPARLLPPATHTPAPGRPAAPQPPPGRRPEGPTMADRCKQCNSLPPHHTPNCPNRPDAGKKGGDR